MNTWAILEQKLNSKHPQIHSGVYDSLAETKIEDKVLESLITKISKEEPGAETCCQILAAQAQKGLISLKTLVDSIHSQSFTKPRFLISLLGKVVFLMIQTKDLSLFNKDQHPLALVIIRYPHCWPWVLEQLHVLSGMYSDQNASALEIFTHCQVFVELAFCDSRIKRQPNIHVHQSLLLVWLKDLTLQYPKDLEEAVVRAHLSIFAQLKVFDSLLYFADSESLLLNLYEIVGYFGKEQGKSQIFELVSMCLLEHIVNAHHFFLPYRKWAYFLFQLLKQMDLEASKISTAIVFAVCRILLEPPRDDQSTLHLLNCLKCCISSVYQGHVVLQRYCTLPLLKLISEDRHRNPTVVSAAQACFALLDDLDGPVGNLELPDNIHHQLSVSVSPALYLSQLHSRVFDFERFGFPVDAQLKLLVVSSLTFHHDPSIKQQAYISLALEFGTTVSAFAFLIHAINQGDAPTKLFLVTKVAPLFTRSKDPFLIAAILKTITSLGNAALKSLALYHLWTEYPRCWIKLRAQLGDVLQRWRVAQVKDSSIEMVFSVILQACCTKDEKNIEELLPLVISALSTSHFSNVSKSLLLQSLRLCIQDNTIDVQSGMKLLMIFINACSLERVTLSFYRS